jgi:hypothetical protein
MAVSGLGVVGTERIRSTTLGDESLTRNADRGAIGIGGEHRYLR